MMQSGIIRRFFLYMFPPRSPQKKKTADLVRLWRELNNERPQFFDPIWYRLTGKMGSLLVLLKKTLDPLKSKDNFMKWKPDDSNIQLVWENLLDEKNLAPRQLDFSYYLSQNPEVDLIEVDNIFQSNLSKITLEDIDFWDKQINEILSIQKLSLFPFYKLLVQWNRGDRDIAYAPAEDCKELLTQLYWLLKPLSGDFATKVWKDLFFPDLPKQSLENLYKFRNNLTAGKHLEKVVQALHKGKLPSINTNVKTSLYFNDVKYSVLEKYNRDRHIEEENRETRIFMKNIKDVFASENLMLPRFYNSNTSYQLEKMGLKPLQFLSQIKLMQNYFNIFYIGKLRDTLHLYQLDLSGKYSEPENDLFSLLDQYNDLEKNMIDWEKSQESSGFSDFGSLDKIIKIDLMLLPVKQMLKTRMKQLEEETRSLIEQYDKTMQYSIRTLRTLMKTLITMQHEVPGSKKQDLNNCMKTFQLYIKNAGKIVNMLNLLNSSHS